MEVTVKGDFKKGKELMKRLRSENTKRIKQLEREHRKLKALLPNKEVKEIEALQKTIPLYSISKTLPVRYEGIVVNGKVLLDFIKKLNGLVYEITSDGSTLILSYGLGYGKWTGELELSDISKYYQGFTDIPELEVYNFLD